MSELKEDLDRAFTGQSRTNSTYLTFAKKAEHEGYEQVAKLFRAAAEAEAIHAQNFLRSLGAIKGTTENLLVALDHAHELERDYPSIIGSAKAEGDTWATKSSCYALESEKIYASLFKKALEELGENEEKEYYICKVCGFTVEDEPPEKCPVCGSRKEAFKRVE